MWGSIIAFSNAKKAHPMYPADPQLQMLSTNTMLNLRTGNLIVDTLVGFVLAAVLVYVVQVKDVISVKGRRYFRRWFQPKHAVRYQGRIYTHKYNESFTETFVAVKDWVVAGIREQKFTNAHTLSEIQLPRSLSLMLHSVGIGQNESDDDEGIPDDDHSFVANVRRHRQTFNKSIIVLEQVEAIKHKTMDLYVRHETFTSGGGSASKDGNDDDVGGNRANEYTEHILTLSSNTMTPNEIVTFVQEHILRPFQERRRQREKDKLFYFLFDRYDTEDSTVCYEQHVWKSTKRYEHVVSDNTAQVQRRIKHFTDHREWYVAHGKPYSLTFLFYGPPGCGKTSMIKAIANATRRHIKEIPLPRVKSRQALMDIFHGTNVGFKHVQPSDCLYVFEEFDKMGEVVQKDVTTDSDYDTDDTRTSNDAAPTGNYVTNDQLHAAIQKAVEQATATHATTSKFAKSASDTPPPLSLGDILNVMDGLIETTGVITIMTANSIHQLNDAIMRPGRIDAVFKFDKATAKTLRTIVQRMYELDDTTLSAVTDTDARFHHKWSPAEIQETCLQEATAKDALAALETEVVC